MASRPEGKLRTIDALGRVWPVSFGWKGVLQWARKPPFFKLSIPVGHRGESLGTVSSSSSACCSLRLGLDCQWLKLPLADSAACYQDRGSSCRSTRKPSGRAAPALAVGLGVGTLLPQVEYATNRGCGCWHCTEVHWTADRILLGGPLAFGDSKAKIITRYVCAEAASGNGRSRL